MFLVWGGRVGWGEGATLLANLSIDFGLLCWAACGGVYVAAVVVLFEGVWR